MPHPQLASTPASGNRPATNGIFVLYYPIIEEASWLFPGERTPYWARYGSQLYAMARPQNEHADDVLPNQLPTVRHERSLLGTATGRESTITESLPEVEEQEVYDAHKPLDLTRCPSRHTVIHTTPPKPESTSAKLKKRLRKATSSLLTCTTNNFKSLKALQPRSIVPEKCHPQCVKHAEPRCPFQARLTTFIFSHRPLSKTKVGKQQERSWEGPLWTNNYDVVRPPGMDDSTNEIEYLQRDQAKRMKDYDMMRAQQQEGGENGDMEITLSPGDLGQEAGPAAPSDAVRAHVDAIQSIQEEGASNTATAEERQKENQNSNATDFRIEVRAIVKVKAGAATRNRPRDIAAMP